MTAHMRLFQGHTENIRGLAFSPDGRLLASGSNDRTLRLWDVTTGECRVLTHHAGLVTSVAFSPSGDRLASGSSDKTARLWDPETGASLATLEHPETPVYTGDIRGGLTALRFSRDGRLLVTLTSSSSIYLWDLEALSERRFDGLKKPWSNSVDIAPDGRWLSAGTDEKTARIWSTSTGKSRLLKGHANKVDHVAFAPDGRFLATAAPYDPATFVWDPSTLAGARLTSGSPSAVTASHGQIAVSPDAAWLARANHDDSVELWDVSPAALAHAGGALSGTPLALRAPPTNALCFSPDSRFLATADLLGGVLVFEVRSGRAAAHATLARGPSEGVYSPDGRRLAFAVKETIAMIEEVHE